jgi:hypothetical protein
VQQTSDILTPYYRLLPDQLIQIIESTGLLCDGQTLHEHDGFRFAMFERRGGHAPELDQDVLFRAKDPGPFF